MFNTLEINVARQHFSGMPIAVITLNGVIDSLSRTELGQTIENLLSEKVYHFVFDLSGVEERVFSSTSLGLFIKLVGAVREESGRVAVVKPPEGVKTAFEVVGLGEYISIANDLESVLKSFLPPA